MSRKKTRRDRNGGRYTPPKSAATAVKQLARYTPAQSAVLTVVDHEVFNEAQDLWPQSWQWADHTPEDYFAHLEEMASEMTESGMEVAFSFIDPADYVDWCRENNLEIDDSQSRAQYAKTDDTIPYDPEMPLWSWSVAVMTFRSELGEFIMQGSCDELEDRLTDWWVEKQGRFKVVTTASRFADHDETELHDHFRGAVQSDITLIHCGEYLSVSTTVSHKGKAIELPTGGTEALEAVLSLGAAGHGLVGVEHRASGSHTFRAWNIAQRGVFPLTESELAEVFGGDIPGAPAVDWPV